ncbi:MAG: hypothetical protein A3H69_01835 [Candidatus Sungbacteria bacterium RIFCSPLOWO2_02_FULL_47_9]|uniref:Membrane fusion protein biotin-lipoyl like domain-containing protein n=2 Tax=Parcubacteria group TaxID=1794811 RepID=A0A1G2RPY6_9BACT|nr:MAG: hypothetical protein A2633_00890 [Candidatus Sungbacteria bacterium RIFCSPHIGHO2_01_FULL_47_32]OHA09543.1 MAG: hypothetical protein A3H69_01835 [Candidatus Sungbacteria bacterium RIFCSPLOWO2_02_FULL_47_9]OHA74903.1 MAG: hypothetical protein A3A32_03585 [Candidatus Wildermuthbacteria bacterium RIFCSPLOWO2_01_FULL_48_35]
MKKFFTRKKIFWAVLILLILGGIGYYFLRNKNNTGAIQTDTVKRLNLKETVLTTGQVVSSTDLSLGFKGSGIVIAVTVKEGDHVKSGQTLAILDQADALASLTSARGSLAQANANYEKVVAGASNETIAVAEKAVRAAEVTLDNAKTSLVNTREQQNTAVQNAYAALLNTSLTAIPRAGNADSVIPAISGTYTGADQGAYQIRLYSGGSGLQFQTNGLENSSGDVQTGPVPMGKRGLYIQFSSTPSPSDTWTVYIPNTYASAYVTNNNAYQAALKTRDSAVASADAQVKSAETALAQAQASLNEKQAKARPADIDVARAQILSAEGQVQTAEAAFANTTLKAPADGTITSVDIKVGEQATAMKIVMVLQNIGDLHAEANVSEASIAALKQGQTVDFTFDALGPDSHFDGTVEAINPASTVISGVVNYKVTAGFRNVPGIKPGMTTNMTILAAVKDNVLAVPQRAVINQAGKHYVRVVDDTKTKSFHQVEVQTGLEADEGLVEIISGLSEGQEVITFMKQ